VRVAVHAPTIVVVHADATAVVIAVKLSIARGASITAAALSPRPAPAPDGRRAAFRRLSHVSRVTRAVPTDPTGPTVGGDLACHAAEPTRLPLQDHTAANAHAIHSVTAGGAGSPVRVALQDSVLEVLGVVAGLGNARFLGDGL